MENNRVKITDFSIRYIFDHETYLAYFDTLDQMMHEACKMYAFNDCYSVEVLLIEVQGDELEYVGWQPGILFQFRNRRTKEIVWERSFPEWDH